MQLSWKKFNVPVGRCCFPSVNFRDSAAIPPGLNGAHWVRVRALAAEKTTATVRMAPGVE